MNRNWTGRRGLMLLPLLFIGTMVCAQQTITLSNKVDLQRNDELIVIKRNDLKTLLKNDKKSFLQIKHGQSNIEAIQYNDTNADGVWDEAVFLYSFKPMEQLTFALSTTKALQPVPVRAHVRQRRKNTNNTFGTNLPKDSIPAGWANTDFSKVKLPPFLTEGPAWENDKVGFRLYFDVRNGKDIWGKTTTAMMMDTVGANPAISYHEKADWGMDILKVGSSLSAGALAIKTKLTSGKDTLIRLGGKNMGRVGYEKIADGPLFAKFRLSYPEWQFAAGHQPISLTEEISIWGGQYFYQSDVKIKNAPEGTQLFTGFADFYALQLQEVQTVSTKAFYTFGLQSENKDKLALAVIAANHDVLGTEKAKGPDIKDSFLVSLKIPKNNNALSFRFLAAWEPSDPRFNDANAVKKFIAEQTALFGSAIDITYK